MSLRELTIYSSLHSVCILRQVNFDNWFILGKICVPFDPERVDRFDVNTVPTLTQVINDLGKGEENLPCMEAPLMIFKNFLKKLNKDQISKGLQKKGDDGMEFWWVYVLISLNSFNNLRSIIKKVTI